VLEPSNGHRWRWVKATRSRGDSSSRLSNKKQWESEE
jgi:hypothetical protein